MIVEDDHSVPIVHVIVASRSGSAADPRHREGLTNLAAEWARRGAGGRSRAALDEAFDALGGTLDVHIEQDMTRFEGEVLARNLDAYLALVADILIRPTFDPAEFARTRQEIEAQIDESRNDDRQLCERFFLRNVYGEHPYGHPPDGVPGRARWRDRRRGRRALSAPLRRPEPDLRLRRRRRARRAHRHAGAGPSTVCRRPRAPPPNALELRAPVPLKGWRIQLVDKPDRQQTQLMFGHATLHASDRDFVPLQIAMAAFGGHGR